MNREPHIDELAVASLSYFPFLALVFLFINRFRNDYFLKYHIIHGLLLSFSSLVLFILCVYIIAFIQSFLHYDIFIVLITGLMITGLLLFFIIYHFVCGYIAYKGNYTVIPLITRIYYRFFDN